MYSCERCTFKLDEIEIFQDIFTDTLSFFTRNDKTEGAFQRGIFRIYFHNTRIELTSFEPTGTCIYGHRAILENVRQKYLGTYYSNTFNT